MRSYRVDSSSCRSPPKTYLPRLSYTPLTNAYDLRRSSLKRISTSCTRWAQKFCGVFRFDHEVFLRFFKKTLR